MVVCGYCGLWYQWCDGTNGVIGLQAVAEQAEAEAAACAERLNAARRALRRAGTQLVIEAAARRHLEGAARMGAGGGAAEGTLLVRASEHERLRQELVKARQQVCA